MRASKFEFEQRFWVIGAIIFVAFSLGAIDPDSDRGRIAELRQVGDLTQIKWTSS